MMGRSHAASGLAWTGYGLALVPLAAAPGTACHLGGDMLTKCGCPLAWPVSMREFHLLPGPLRFTTGHWPERLIVMPVLLAALALLGWHDIAGMSLITHVQR